MTKRALSDVIAGRLGLGGGGVDALAQADAARDRRDWREAARRYRAVLRAAPERGPIWVQYGHALKESGRLGDAEAAYRRAVALMPQDGDAAIQLGHALKLLGRRDGAIGCYARAFALDRRRRDAIGELRGLGLSDAEVAAAIAREADEAAPATARPRPRLLWDVTGACSAPPGGGRRRALAALEAAAAAGATPVTIDAESLSIRALPEAAARELAARIAAGEAPGDPPLSAPVPEAELGEAFLVVDPSAGLPVDRLAVALRTAGADADLAVAVALFEPPAAAAAGLRRVARLADCVLAPAESVAPPDSRAIARLAPGLVVSTAPPAHGPGDPVWLAPTPADAAERESLGALGGRIDRFDDDEPPGLVRRRIAAASGLVAPASAPDAALWIADALAAGRPVVASSRRADLFWRFGRSIAAYVDVADPEALARALDARPGPPRRDPPAPVPSPDPPAGPSAAGRAPAIEPGAFYALDAAPSLSRRLRDGTGLRVGPGWREQGPAGARLAGTGRLDFRLPAALSDAYRVAVLHGGSGATLDLALSVAPGATAATARIALGPGDWGWETLAFEPVGAAATVRLTLAAAGDGEVWIGGLLAYPADRDRLWFEFLDEAARGGAPVLRRLRSRFGAAR